MPKQMAKARTVAKQTSVRKRKNSVPMVPSLPAPKKKAIVDTLCALNEQDLIEVCTRAGIGSKYLTCSMCGELKNIDEFYVSSDPNVRTGKVRICKECCERIVYKKNDRGDKKPPTKQSFMHTLEYLDKPYIENIFNSSVAEEKTYADKGTDRDFWKNYMSQINSMANRYATMRWCDSDGLHGSYMALEKGVAQEAVTVAITKDQVRENQERYEVNKRDTIKFCGYDPFANYPVEADKGRLYAQVVGFLDDESKSDGMKLNSIIQIVKRLNQAEKLNDQIDSLLNDSNNVLSSQAIINKMMDSSKKDLDIAIGLARDNGISINYNNNKSAGQQTLSGKIKKLTEEGLREAKVNTFDVGSCAGMKKVAELSAEARHKQIGVDENVLTEIKDIKVQRVEELTKERNEARERARLLLVENRDLKKYMCEKGIADSDGNPIEYISSNIEANSGDS